MNTHPPPPPTPNQSGFATPLKPGNMILCKKKREVIQLKCVHFVDSLQKFYFVLI